MKPQHIIYQPPEDLITKYLVAVFRLVKKHILQLFKKP